MAKKVRRKLGRRRSSTAWEHHRQPAGMAFRRAGTFCSVKPDRIAAGRKPCRTRKFGDLDVREFRRNPELLIVGNPGRRKRRKSRKATKRSKRAYMRKYRARVKRRGGRIIRFTRRRSGRRSPVRMTMTIRHRRSKRRNPDYLGRVISGYAYEFTGSGSWRKSSSEDWETVIAEEKKVRRLGNKVIDGARCIVVKAGGKILAVTHLS